MGKRMLPGLDKKSKHIKTVSHRPMRANPNEVQFNEVTRKWELRKPEIT